MKILITGSSGLVGKAIKRISKNEKYSNNEFIFISSSDGSFILIL